jgi:hypothetical protein
VKVSKGDYYNYMTQFLTELEFRTIIRRSSITCRKWRAAGKGPKWVRLEKGGPVLYSFTEVAAWLIAQGVVVLRVHPPAAPTRSTY